MHPKSIEAAAAGKPLLSPADHYCNCALPIVVERAERRGAAQRACARCGLPMAARWRS
jgi:hypothetical protein